MMRKPSHQEIKLLPRGYIPKKVASLPSHAVLHMYLYTNIH